MPEDTYWFCSFGEHMSHQRIASRISGGKPTRGRAQDRGAENKEFFDKWEAVQIPYRIRFALPKGRKTVHMWGDGGIPYISNNAEDEFTTLARIWWVTNFQYFDIYKQMDPFIDHMIKVGTHEGAAMFAIGRKDHESLITSAPSESYLLTMMEGLHETFPQMTQEGMTDYLFSIEGMEEWDREKVLAMCDIAWNK